MLKNLNDYTEREFLQLLQTVYSGDANTQEADDIVYYLNTKVQHPEGSGLLTHPTECNIEDSPEGIINELKRWYTEQGLPLFKDE